MDESESGERVREAIAAKEKKPLRFVLGETFTFMDVLTSRSALARRVNRLPPRKCTQATRIIARNMSPASANVKEIREADGARDCAGRAAEVLLGSPNGRAVRESDRSLERRWVYFVDY